MEGLQMGARIRLPVVSALVAASEQVRRISLPLARGDDDENLACGACGAIIARNMSARSLYRRYSSPTGRMLVRCRCGACCAINVTKA